MAWGKRATDDLARIADALEKQNELLRLVLEHNDYRFKEWMNRKFGKLSPQSGEERGRGYNEEDAPDNDEGS